MGEKFQGWERMSSNNSKMKRPLVPRLRFPEFREAGEWEYYQLGQCLSSHPEYGVNAAAVPYAENLPTYLRITDISEDGQIRLDQKVSVEKDITDENYLEDGDIVLARTGASVGRAYKYRPKDGRLVFAGFLIRIRPNQEKLISEFLFQFLASEQYWRWVDFTSARSGQPGINANEYASLPLQLPPTIKEQQKIADCLSSLDERITLEAQKLEALKRHKKGLMQQLFPREGTVPRLRFPEFREAGEWEVKAISELGELFGGLIAKSGDDFGQGSPFVTYRQIFERNYIDMKECGRVKVEEDETQNNLQQGDILFTASSETPDEVGVASVILTDPEIDTYLNSFCFALRPYNQSSLNSQFSRYLFHSAGYRKSVTDIAQGSTRFNISKSAFRQIRIAITEDEKEQQKIADCLSSLDDLISLHSQKIELLKRHKNGLMQQLFPVMDEILA